MSDTITLKGDITTLSYCKTKRFLAVEIGYTTYIRFVEPINSVHINKINEDKFDVVAKTENGKSLINTYIRTKTITYEQVLEFFQSIMEHSHTTGTIHIK